MRGKLTGLLVCVALLLAFPCVGVSEQGDGGVRESETRVQKGYDTSKEETRLLNLAQELNKCSDVTDEEKRFLCIQDIKTKLHKQNKEEKFRHCLITSGSSWNLCAANASAGDEELAKQFQFNIPESNKKTYETYDDILKEQGLERRNLGLGNLFSGGYRINPDSPVWAYEKPSNGELNLEQTPKPNV